MTGATAARVTVYGAADCSLCGPVKQTVDEVAGRLGVQVEHVDISGVDRLERRYRAHIPVVEIDGEEAFRYYAPAAAFEARLRDALAAADG